MHRTLFSNAEWIIIMINKIVHCYLKLNIIYRIANSRILCSFLSSIKFGSMNPLYTHFQMEGKRPVGFDRKASLVAVYSLLKVQKLFKIIPFLFSFHFIDTFFCTKIPFLIDHCRANKSISFIISTIIFFQAKKTFFAQFGRYSQIPHRFLLLSIAIETAHILILCLFWLYFAF